MEKDLSRRGFLKGAAVSVAAVGLAGCSPKVVNTANESEAGVIGSNSGEACVSDFSSFFTASAAEQEEIKNSTDGGEYDIIVIGAGASGVPCAVKAYQEGAKVLVLQKEATVVSQGGNCNGIEADTSDPSAILNFIQETTKQCTYRNDREQTKVFAYNSGEAVHWYYDEAVGSGYNIGVREWGVDYGEDFGQLKTIWVVTSKPDNTSTSMKSIMAAYEDKIDVRYNTPAVQLIKEGNKVTGVYAKDIDGAYYKFNATKGVVIATGDYQNNDAMVAKYCPDVLDFEKKQFNKTGDGQLLGMMIGAEMEPLGHTKMIHDFDSGPMFDERFLRVDMYAKRFSNEDMDLSVVNNYLRNYGPEMAGKYCQIFDGNYVEQVTSWGGRPTDEEALLMYMPDVEMENRKGVLVDRIDTHKADTLDELATILQIPADELKSTVKRYNELVDKGWDADFGKKFKYMKKIEKAPFYGIRKNLRVSALCSGIVINENFEVLDSERKPIEQLYAIGNVSGAFYGSPDYPLNLPGLSLGRCVTSGYVLGKTLAAK